MRAGQIFFSLVALMMSLGALAFGLFFLVGNTLSATELHWTGLALILFALLLIFCFILLSRRRYLLLEMGGVSVLGRVIAQEIERELSPLFEEELYIEVMVRSNQRVEVLLNLPYLLEEKLEEIELCLTRILAKQYHYRRPFCLNVKFEKQHFSP